MSETPKSNKNNNKKDMDISSVMDKIVEETIGHIPVATPTPIKKMQKNARVSRKSVDKAKNSANLPSKKKVAVDENATTKKPTKAAQPKKEVELFFPDGKAKQTKTQAAKKTQQTPKQTKKQPPKQTKKQPPKQTKKQSPKQTKKQPPKQQPPKQTKPQQPKQVNKPVPVTKPQVQSVQQVEEAPKKKHILRNVLLGLFGVILLGALGVYGYFAYHYYDKFIPGTYINEIDAHELNAQQVEEQIRRRVEDYAIEIDFRDGKKETITGDAIDYAFVSDGSVERILKEQNWLIWVKGYFEEYRHEVSESTTFDNAKLQKEYSALPETQRENQEGPKDAYVFYQHKNWEIIPEIDGTTIDNDILYAALSNAIHASIKTCSAEEAKAYLEPKIRKEDPNLATEVLELNALVGASILYKLPQGDEILDGNMLKLWIQRDASGHYTKDEEIFNGHVESYVERMAEATDTIGKPRRFKMTGGGEVEVEGKNYGWKIDKYTETEKLKEELAANAKVEREPEYASREAALDNNGFGGTYIEVNLSLQHLYVYREGRLILESDFVSGRMTSTRWTPPGIFRLTNKQKGKVLRGPLQPDGSYEWESPVTYWMPFNRGIGFHDANWRGTFGGNIYNYSGSHGCINMPYKKAQALYDIITKEFIIVCFYSEDYAVRRG